MSTSFINIPFVMPRLPAPTTWMYRMTSRTYRMALFLLLALLLAPHFLGQDCYGQDRHQQDRHRRGSPAHDYEISARVGYPVPVGDNVLAEQYESVIAGRVTFSYPMSDHLRIQAGVQYDRLRGVSNVDVYTPSVGLAYSLPLTNRFNVVPEAGLTYSRVVFTSLLDLIAPSYQNGLGIGLGIEPRYAISEAWQVGFSLSYRSTFMDQPERAPDTSFVTRYQVFVFSLTGTYTF